MGKILSNTIGRQLVAHAFEGMSDLTNQVVRYDKETSRLQSHQVCRNLDCNRGTQPDALSGVRTSIRRLQSNIRISQTTSTLAYASGCIRARIHMHPLSYRGRVASACTRWPDVPVHEDEKVIASAVESSAHWGSCAARGNEVGQVGIQQGSTKVGRFDHLKNDKVLRNC
jgi:hypothetical protein